MPGGERADAQHDRNLIRGPFSGSEHDQVEAGQVAQGGEHVGDAGRNGEHRERQGQPERDFADELDYRPTEGAMPTIRRLLGSFYSSRHLLDPVEMVHGLPGGRLYLETAQYERGHGVGQVVGDLLADPVQFDSGQSRAAPSSSA